jgi:uncharacterized protein
LDQSLTDEEYDRLAAVLRRFPSEDAMDLEEMDGFFAALICGPVTVLPSEYLSEIWGTGEAPFTDTADLEEFLNLAMRHWNFIARELHSPDLTFVPLLGAEEARELPRGNRWARGFLRGVGMCRDEWKEIFEDDDKFAMLLAVMALVHENDSDPEMRTWKTLPSPKIREHVCVGLGVSTQRLHDYFRSHRLREPRRGTGTARQTKIKIGRNEPCYCGSGKKYKHCCGNVTIN